MSSINKSQEMVAILFRIVDLGDDIYLLNPEDYVHGCIPKVGGMFLDFERDEPFDVPSMMDFNSYSEVSNICGLCYGYERPITEFIDEISELSDEELAEKLQFEMQMFYQTFDENIYYVKLDKLNNDMTTIIMPKNKIEEISSSIKNGSIDKENNVKNLSDGIYMNPEFLKELLENEGLDVVESLYEMLDDYNKSHENTENKEEVDISKCIFIEADYLRNILKHNNIEIYNEIAQLLKKHDEESKDGDTVIDNSKKDGIYIYKEQLRDLVNNNNFNIIEILGELLAQYDDLSTSDNIQQKNIEIKKDSTESPIRKKIILDDFEKYVKSRVVGQDEAIERIVTSIAMNYRTKNKKRLKNILSVGPTGVGKTETFEAIGDYLDVPVTIYPTSKLSQTGYIGDDVEDILSMAYNSCGGKLSALENGILVFDEADKIARRGSGVNDEAVQNILLKVLDGQKYQVALGSRYSLSSSVVNIDTSLMSKACLGAFSELFEKRLLDKHLGFQTASEVVNNKRSKITTEQLIEYGMIREFIGRFSTIVEYNNLKEENLYKILCTKSCSPLERFKDSIYELFGTEIITTEDYMRRIVSDAAKMNTGARSLQSQVDASTYQIERYLLNNDNIKQIILNNDTIDDPHKFLIKK